MLGSWNMFQLLHLCIWINILDHPNPPTSIQPYASMPMLHATCMYCHAHVLKHPMTTAATFCGFLPLYPPIALVSPHLAFHFFLLSSSFFGGDFFRMWPKLYNGFGKNIEATSSITSRLLLYMFGGFVIFVRSLCHSWLILLLTNCISND